MVEQALITRIWPCVQRESAVLPERDGVFTDVRFPFGMFTMRSVDALVFEIIRAILMPY